MNDKSKDIAHCRQLLEQNRANLRKQREQQSTYAKGEERLALLNQIEASEEGIREAKARLRELGVEPEPSTIDPPEEFKPFEELFIKNYPFPIAQACADFNRESEMGRRFVILDRLITHLIKYMAAIFIGQARIDKPNEYPLPEKLNWIATPTMEDWTEAICKLSQLYNKSPHREACKIPDLIQASCRPLLGRQELVDAIDFLSIQLVKPGIDEPTVVDFLQLLAWYREREWQDAAAQYPMEKIKTLMLRLQPALAVLLNELESLRRHQPVYIEWLDAVGNDIHLRTVKFMGLFTEDLQPFNKPALILPQEKAKQLKRHRFYIADSDDMPYIDLHPFFVLYQWELYALERLEPWKFVEFRSCSRGTRLRLPPEARTFYASLWEEQIHGEGEPSEEVPPVPGEEEIWTDSVEEIPSDDPTESLPLTWLNAEGRQALEIALGEALRLGHFWLGIEFLLMGMTKQDGCAMSELFHQIGISRGQFRGVIRGIVGVSAKDDWRDKNPFELGAQALPEIQPADPNTLAAKYQAGKEQPPVFTPRMKKILEDASKLANEAQIGHDHLLLAALKHYQSPAVGLLLGIAAEAGWNPERVQNWIIQQAGITGKPPYEAPDQGPGPPKSPPSSMTPVKGLLGKYGRDLNEEARAKRIHAAIGVDALLRRMKRILIQRKTNNPLLLGEAGVGKTAIVEGLAFELVHGDPGIPELANKRIIELSINSLVAGTKYRGELEERVERMIAEVKASPDIIIFIDEIHTVLGGGSDSVSNIANALKPALERGEFHCIGSTTISEYRKYIEKDPALSRRFETILVEEPNIDDCIKILEGVKGDIEVHHNTHISKSAIEAAVILSHRYIQDERLPAKAIKLLEQAAAYVRLPSFYGDPEASQEDVQPLFTEVNEDLIRYLLSKKTGIPLERLEGDELKRIKGIEEALKAQVIGQDEAVHAVSQVIKRSRAGLRDPQKPVGVFLFVGPTGVGKTELARALAGFLFNDREAIIRLDMSEYMEKHQVSRLIGAPPGYVGYDEEGQLTGKLRLKPFSVVLLDEIEKAHEEVHNIFLQLFDEGRLTDAKGNTVNGREAIFIMTSNVGSELYLQDSAGFSSKERLSPEWLKEKRTSVTKAIHEKFKPEFLNRVDQVIHFNPLTMPHVTRIFQLQFQAFINRLTDSHQISLTITPEAESYVCKEGYDSMNGARPLKRAIERLIIEPLTDMILEGKIKAKDKITVNSTGLQLTFEKEKPGGEVS